MIKSTISYFDRKFKIKYPADDRILECAVEGEVDYLVSGNKHLLDVKEFQGIKIVTIKQILEILGV
jgi:predicted nucleic acid-binding protein